MKITIEDIGTFSIPPKAATYFQEMAEERIAAISRADAAEAEVVRLREQVAELTARIAELSAEYMALLERTSDW